MNSRYTFKAKRKDNGEWVYGDLIHTRKSHFGKEDENILIISSITNSTDYNEIIPETLCACTGQPDIEGNYIFENDIVIYDNSEKHICSWDFFLEYNKILYQDKVKIIGNKFDEYVVKE